MEKREQRESQLFFAAPSSPSKLLTHFTTLATTIFHCLSFFFFTQLNVQIRELSIHILIIFSLIINALINSPFLRFNPNSNTHARAPDVLTMVWENTSGIEGPILTRKTLIFFLYLLLKLDKISWAGTYLRWHSARQNLECIVPFSWT